jgi:hypothetical protein
MCVCMYVCMYVCHNSKNPLFKLRAKYVFGGKKLKKKRIEGFWNIYISQYYDYVCMYVCSGGCI